MSFAADTVHGLSADVYYDSSQVRVFGDVVWSTTQESLPLTANDEGNVNPVDVLRRGDVTRVTVPVSDVTGLPTLSGVIFPFSAVVSGASGDEVLLPKAAVGDSYLTEAKELRLVARDGSFTMIAPSACAVEVGDVAMSEENQMVAPVTFQLFRATISGVETPYKLVSGSHATGLGI